MFLHKQEGAFVMGLANRDIFRVLYTQDGQPAMREFQDYNSVLVLHEDTKTSNGCFGEYRVGEPQLASTVVGKYGAAIFAESLVK